MRLRASGDEVTIVGLLGRRSLDGDRVVQWGFTRAGVGQALYFLTDDDQPLVVRSVSSAARGPVSAEAQAVPRSLPGLRRARPSSAGDPLPKVPVAAADFTPTAPVGGTAVWTAGHDPQLGPPIRSFLLRYSALGLVIAVYLIGFAAAAPGHRGLIAAAAAVFVVIFAASLAGIPLLLRRAAVMLDGATVARRQPGRGWQSFNLKALRGVGLKRRCPYWASWARWPSSPPWSWWTRPASGSTCRCRPSARRPVRPSATTSRPRCRSARRPGSTWGRPGSRLTARAAGSVAGGQTPGRPERPAVGQTEGGDAGRGGRVPRSGRPSAGPRGLGQRGPGHHRSQASGRPPGVSRRGPASRPDGPGWPAMSRHDAGPTRRRRSRRGSGPLSFPRRAD